MDKSPARLKAPVIELVDSPSSSKLLHQESQNLLKELGIAEEEPKLLVEESKIEHAVQDIFDKSVLSKQSNSLTAAGVKAQLEEQWSIKLGKLELKLIRKNLWKLADEYSSNPSIHESRVAPPKTPLSNEPISDLKAKDLSSVEPDVAVLVENKKVEKVEGKAKVTASQDQTEVSTKQTKSHFQRKSTTDTRHAHLDKPGALPIFFPSSFSKASTPVLVQLESANPGKSFNLGGDTGSIGRLSVVPASGKGAPQKRSGKVNPLDSLGSTLRIDLKGDVYQGVFTPIQQSVMVVSIAGSEVKVETVLDRCVIAKHDRNILSAIRGDRVSGEVDISKFVYKGDVNVNDNDVSSEDGESQKSNTNNSKKRKTSSKRKPAASKSRKKPRKKTKR